MSILEHLRAQLAAANERERKLRETVDWIGAQLSPNVPDPNAHGAGGGFVKFWKDHHDQVHIQFPSLEGEIDVEAENLSNAIDLALAETQGGSDDKSF
jgi:hypothetical protein